MKLRVTDRAAVTALVHFTGKGWRRSQILVEVVSGFFEV